MRISIVTPSFNQGDLLNRSMRSVLEQEGEGFELEYIVVDGGSTDGSREIIESHADKLAWWCSERDGGQYAAVNKGFAKSTGEVMAWINSSDLYFPWTLQSVSEIFDEYPEIQWITSLYKCCIDETGTFRSIQRSYGHSARAFAAGLNGGSENQNFIQQEACFWRRSLWDKIGGEIKPTYKLAADFHLWSEFFDHAELVGIHAPLAAFRHHGNQRSKLSNYQEEVETELARLAAKGPREACAVTNLYPPAVHNGSWGQEVIPPNCFEDTIEKASKIRWTPETIANDELLFLVSRMEQDLQEKEKVISGLITASQQRLTCIEEMQKHIDSLQTQADLPFQIRKKLWEIKQKLLNLLSLNK
jgi:hypothetical protein